MSDEHDSWFKSAFGVDLGQAVQGIKDEASAAIGQAASTVTQVVQGVQGVVEGAIGGVTGAVTGAAKKVAGVVSGSPSAGASGGGTGSFPLGGSVGRGGKNAPNDVRAVQAALGIAADGQCGNQTFAAIEAFQRNKGLAKADGRVDAGGATERALAGGARPAPAPAAAGATGAGDDSGGLLDQLGGLAQDAESSVQSALQSAQHSVLTGLGVSAETEQGIQAAEQAIADFESGRKKGHADAVMGFLNILPPVQGVKAGIRIAESDDPEAEAAKILQEKSESAAALGEFMDNPIAGSAKMGASMGTSFAKGTLNARDEGRLAGFAGELTGHAQFAGELAGIGVGVGSLLEGGAVAGEAGAIGTRGAAGASEAEGVISPLARSVRNPGVIDPLAATENPLLSPLARSVRNPGVVDPFAATENPLLSPLARSVRNPGGAVEVAVGEGGEGGAAAAREAGAVEGLGEGLPGKARVKGPPTEVDPAKPQPKPKGPKANAAQTREQIRQNLTDATAEQKAAEKASSETTQRLIRFRANKPFDPDVAKVLEDQAQRASNANGEAIVKLRAAQAAEKAARDAAGRAKGPRAGRFPPPR